MAAALLSVFAETSQLVMLYRFPSLIDVATNVLGAILGLIIVARYNLKPQFKATKPIGAVAAALALLLILGVWTMSGNWPSDRGATTPGTGSLEAHWTFDESSGRIAVDLSGHDLNGEYHSEPKRVAGPMGSAVKFDGTADYVDFGDPLGSAVHQQHDDQRVDQSTFFPRDDAAIVSSRSNGVGFNWTRRLTKVRARSASNLGTPAGRRRRAMERRLWLSTPGIT